MQAQTTARRTYRKRRPVLRSFYTKPAFRPLAGKPMMEACHELAFPDDACDGEGWRARVADAERQARARAWAWPASAVRSAQRTDGRSIQGGSRRISGGALPGAEGCAARSCGRAVRD